MFANPDASICISRQDPIVSSPPILTQKNCQEDSSFELLKMLKNGETILASLGLTILCLVTRLSSRVEVQKTGVIFKKTTLQFFHDPISLLQNYPLLVNCREQMNISYDVKGLFYSHSCHSRMLFRRMG